MKRKFLVLVVLFLVFNLYSATNRVEKSLVEKIKNAGDSKTYKNSDVLIIDEIASTQVEKDGSFVSDNYMLVKILTERGKKDFSSRRFPYHKRYNKVEVLLARVIHSDGTYENVEKKNIKDQTMAETQKMNIFEDNFREVRVEFPPLKVGDAIEIKIKMYSKPLLKNNYSDISLLQSFIPVKNVRIELKIDKKLPLNYVVKNGKLKMKKMEEGKYNVYQWTGSNIKPFKKEIGMISPYDMGLKLIVSTFKNWKELSSYGAELNRGKIDKTPKMVKIVKELIKGKKTEKEKILAIFRYISQKIRYMGSSMDVGAFIEPHKASYTFNKQYGVCRDKSILMIAMLKIAGIEADDVLINVSHKTDIEVPTIFFEHAIVGVKLKNGKYVYMDPTLELSSDFGEAYMSGKYVLHLVEKGKDIRKIQIFPPEKSMGYIKAESKVNEKGELESDFSIEGKGTYDLIMRQIGKRFPGKMQTFIWNKILQSMQQGTVVEKAEYGNPEDLTKPYKIKIKVKAPNFFEKLGNFYLMKIPEGKSTADIYFSLVVYNLTRLNKRMYPVNMTSPLGSKIKETITIPPSYKIKAFPDSFEFKKPPVYLSVKIIKIDKNKIKFVRVYKQYKSIFSPEDYSVLKEALLKMDKFNKSFIILEREVKK